MQNKELVTHLNFTKKITCAVEFLYMFSLFEKRSVDPITPRLH